MVTWMAWPRKEDHEIHYKQVVNSTCMLVFGSVVSICKYVVFIVNTPIIPGPCWGAGVDDSSGVFVLIHPSGTKNSTHSMDLWNGICIPR